MSSTAPITLTPIGVDLGDLRAGQAQDDVDVVNHHVEHDADVDAAERHRADASDLDEPRLDVELCHGPHRGIESLDVPDLHGHAGFRAAVLTIRCASATSLAKRLFDQAGDAAGEIPFGDNRRGCWWARRWKPPVPPAADRRSAPRPAY